MKLAALFLSIAAFGADIAGKWDFVWETPGGERRSTLTLTVEKAIVWVAFPESKAPMKGTIDGSKIKVEGKLYSAEAGSEGVFRMDGTIDGASMKGTASWEEHAMSFRAKRQNSN